MGRSGCENELEPSSVKLTSNLLPATAVTARAAIGADPVVDLVAVVDSPHACRTNRHAA